MTKTEALTESEINYLEMVYNGNYLNVASAPNGIETLVFRGYILKTHLVVMPMMPARYDYRLSVNGLILLRQYRPQYN